MRINIRAVPRFSFKPTLTTLQSLETCALLHTNMNCRVTAAPGGLVYTMLRSFAFNGKDGAPFELWARDIELLILLCEHPPGVLTENAVADLADFYCSMKLALDKAKEVTFNWNTSTEPEKQT